ncbi:MAG: hypothetical protein R3C45_02740 [Phycisphaerales bacterium]
MGEAADWIERYRRFWESFDRLDDYLRELQSKQAKAEADTETEAKADEPQQSGPDIQTGMDESHW